jgi:hypothetical protein
VLTEREKCAKGQRFSRKQKRCVSRRCKRSQRWSKKSKSCVVRRCSKSLRWSKKIKRCLRRKCPRRFRWLRKSKRCVRGKKCPKGQRWGRKSRRCVARKCARGQRFSKKSKRCVRRVRRGRKGGRRGSRKGGRRGSRKGGRRGSRRGGRRGRKVRRCPRGLKWLRKSKRCVKRRCNKKVLRRYTFAFNAICRRNLLISSTPKDMTGSLWGVYLRVLRRKAKLSKSKKAWRRFRAAKRINRRFISRLNKNLLRACTLKCNCQNSMNKKTFDAFKVGASRKCQKICF